MKLNKLVMVIVCFLVVIGCGKEDGIKFDIVLVVVDL